MKSVKEMEPPVTELPLRPPPLVPVREGAATRRVPPHNWRGHWLSVSEFAFAMDRHEQTVYKWLRNGTLADFGVPVVQFRRGQLHYGRTFIYNI
jgi:hypothetical protein